MRKLSLSVLSRDRKGVVRYIPAFLLTAAAILTTEKDAANLSFPVPNLYWLEIRMEINDEERFLAEIQRQIE